MTTASPGDFSLDMADYPDRVQQRILRELTLPELGSLSVTSQSHHAITERLMLGPRKMLHDLAMEALEAAPMSPARLGQLLQEAGVCEPSLRAKVFLAIAACLPRGDRAMVQALRVAARDSINARAFLAMDRMLAANGPDATPEDRIAALQVLETELAPLMHDSVAVSWLGQRLSSAVRPLPRRVSVALDMQPEMVAVPAVPIGEARQRRLDLLQNLLGRASRVADRDARCQALTRLLIGGLHTADPRDLYAAAQLVSATLRDIVQRHHAENMEKDDADEEFYRYVLAAIEGLMRSTSPLREAVVQELEDALEAGAMGRAYERSEKVNQVAYIRAALLDIASG